MKKPIVLLLCAALAVTSLAGCGSAKKSGEAESTAFTWMIDQNEDSVYYESYSENPVIKYWLAKEWDADGDGTATSIDVEFNAPVQGSENDYVNTLMATGEYPDVMSMSYVSEPIRQLYDEGIALDLTDYIAEYMPNYTKWLEENPAYAEQMAVNIDGEKKYLQIYCVADRAPDAWCGYMYRRDWIVKYGKNPQTGEAFTGGWNEDKTEWTDDVVFPSGGSDPVYISDWEWMLAILNTALQEEQIDDGYAYQVYYMGHNPLGDFVSGFNAVGGYYLNEDGECVHGGDSDGFRAYVECMNTWYEKGYLQKDFDENLGGMFWSTDVANVYAGKVGAWYGMNSSLGNGLDTGESECTDGICVYGAQQPINDVYGSDECKYHEPTCYFGNGVVTTSVIITNKAAEKDLPSLLTAIDYFFSYEGGLLCNYGFSDEQQEEIQDTFYTEMGLDNGAYTRTVDENGEEGILVDQKLKTTEGLETACHCIRVPSFGIHPNVDEGYTDIQKAALALWQTYPSTGSISDTVTAQLSAEDADNGTVTKNNIMQYMSQEIPKFIKGERDVDSDSDWESYCQGLAVYDPQAYCDAINNVLGK